MFVYDAARMDMTDFGSCSSAQRSSLLQDSTGKERDTETGLDYFLARYYSGAQGRFLSPDEFKGGPDDALTGAEIAPPGPLPYADITNPQSLNKYTYVLNNPLKYTDPDGHFWDTVLDVAGIGYDIYDLATAPSWSKAGTLGLDVVLAAVPFVPTVGGVKAGAKLLDKADDVVDLVTANRAAGKAAEAKVAAELVGEGKTIIGSQVCCNTGEGRRVIDHLTKDATGKITAVEVKSGSATRSVAQRTKDAEIAAGRGTFVGKNAPQDLRGKQRPVKTVERKPKCPGPMCPEPK